VLVFTRMEPLQQTALNLLYAQGFANPEKYPSGQIQVVTDQFQKMNLQQPATLSQDILEFLVNTLGRLTFQGPGGLKDRTGLLEYRYDAL
jgi:hypothetical protein